MTLRSEAMVYLDHIVSLFLPGRAARQHQAVPDPLAAVGDLEQWTDAEVTILVEESRRALDLQHTRFDRTRTTAQVLLPTGIALLVVFGSELDRLDTAASGPGLALVHFAWSIGALFILLSTLGAAATLAVRADFGSILPTLLSQMEHPIERDLARSYAEQCLTGETTLVTRLTVVRDAVSLLAAGGVAQVVIWIAWIL